MSLSKGQKRHLKALAHRLNPVVMVGQAGVTEGVLGETRAALDHHELIKLKVSAGDRGMRDLMIAELAHKCEAELVQRIGNVAVLFRPNPKKKAAIALPDP